MHKKCTVENIGIASRLMQYIVLVLSVSCGSIVMRAEQCLFVTPMQKDVAATDEFRLEADMRLSRQRVVIFICLLLLTNFSIVPNALGVTKTERAEFCKKMEAGLSATHRISASGLDNTTIDVEFKRRTSESRSWAADFFKIYGLDILKAGFLKIRFSTIDDAWDFPLDK